MNDREAQEGRFWERNDSAFGFVDDEFEGPLQVACDARQDALARTRAVAQNDNGSIETSAAQTPH
jgi:hypothetical protein